MADKAKKKDADAIQVVQRNRKAHFHYEILEKVEAGLVLAGPEVKSVRAGNVSIHEAYARVKKGELWVINMEIAAYKDAGPFNREPKRPRKLLLKKREINRLVGKTQERGLSLVPLALYFKNGFAKLEVGLGRGKKLWDKREAIKKRDVSRDLRRNSARR